MTAALAAEHSLYCGKHGMSCPDCGGSMHCAGCRVHGGQQLWELECGACGRRASRAEFKYLLEAEVPEPPQYGLAVHDFTTPRGNTARMHYRTNTNDWNTIHASMVEDEYGLATLPPLSGLAIDIGAYVGSVGIMLALDNTGLRVVCIEPVPANALLATQNAMANNVDNRLVVLEAAAGGPEDREAVVDWGYVGEPHLEHHAFVGNTTLVYEYGSNPTYSHQETIARCYSLSHLMEALNADSVALLKIDCEGCEWRVLADPSMDKVAVVVGEWHTAPSCRDSSGRKPSRGYVRELLPNHNVSFTGPEAGPGGFMGVHK